MFSVQLFEMLLKTLVWNSRLFQHRMDVVDGICVCIALTATIISRTQHSHGDIVSFIIIVRLWRVSKIFNALVTNIRSDAERRVMKERRARRALQREVAKLRDYCMQQECEMQMYRLMISQQQQQSGAHHSQMPPPLPPPTHPFAHCGGRTLHVIAEVNTDDTSSYCGRATISPCSSSPSSSTIANTRDGVTQQLLVDEHAAPPEYTETDVLNGVFAPTTSAIINVAQHSPSNTDCSSSSPPPPI